VTVQRRFSEWSALATKTQYALAATARERARRLEPLLHAFVAIEDSAVRPPVCGSLALTPYAAKDLLATPTHRPAAGLAEVLDFGVDGDAEVLRQLDGAGAFRIGFTAMTELAYEPSGYNAVCHSPRNPWNFDFIPGGSSSGSAVAVASGTAVIALGSDTGGSLRIPAHCTGVTAWKPTHGTVSVAGALPLAPSLDTIGLLSRAAVDLRPAAAALMARDRSAASAPVERVIVLGDVLDAAEASVRKACQQGIDAIEACGVAVARGEGLPAIESIDAHALNVMQAEAARVHMRWLDHRAVNSVLRRRLAKGLSIDDATLTASRRAHSQLANDFIVQILGKADAAILPVMAIRTPHVDETDPASPSFSARRLYALSRYCRFVNMLGFPAVAIPVGFDDRGLPVALQIVGRPGRDSDLIDLAVEVQQETDWHGRVPHELGDRVHDLEKVLV
jgi:aspartyl-tRNA(Asn)/glutamyl-tRNA(Gln) amidotransferase subunit A